MRFIEIWILVIIVVGYLIVNNVYVTYETKNMMDGNAYCSNNTLLLRNDMYGDAKNEFNTWNSITCLKYITSKCKPVCENNAPVCKCQATIMNMYFTPKSHFGY